ncbi:mechanosensitive ion channel family protein [Reichenbachiella agarivorans]|uniref:Mechanosensitive ion channel family protein n=1 Tax=Reichenbachiella agarivorans TaxID=2979464 RepID=A0ABY6CW46_9BACT|nr:mechanosensitive ion channel family protein [Reichenbachiella agarivorans]UXP33613.1 mechanosensitive ion channel family protein [Reichenbachiella agarivorans]
MRKLAFILLPIFSLLSWTKPLLASEGDSITILLESPYQALRTFVKYTERSSIQDYKKASVVFNDPSLSVDEKTKYAKKLEQILEGAGVLLQFNSIPSDPNHYDSLQNDYLYTISNRYPEIYLQKRRGRWQFQREVLTQIDSVHHELFQFGTNILFSQEQKDNLLGDEFLGLKTWQWIGIGIVFLAGYLVRFIFSLVFEKIIIQLLEKLGQGHIGSRYILPIAKPTGMVCVLILISVFYPLLQLPRQFGVYIVFSLKALIPLFGIIILYRMVNIVEIYLVRLVGKTESKLDDQLVPILKKTLRILIVVVGVLVILDNINIPILPLLTGLSIGGLAFALAAQDTIKNFFGSLMIFIDKPFQIGDWITSGDIDGTVEEVGFRSTRIRTFRNSVISVPNGQLADSTIDNNGLRQYRRFRTILAITYDTPPERIEVFVEGLKKIVQKHPNTNNEKFEIYLNDMGAHSLDILFYIFFEAATWSDELKFRQEIILEILKLGRLLSVHFAFPTQTLHVENMPGQPSLSPEYTLTKQDLNDRLNQYFGEKA